MTLALKLIGLSLLFSVGVGCTLAAEVDRSKIGAGGESGQESSNEE
jgi:hypothetical protein